MKPIHLPLTSEQADALREAGDVFATIGKTSWPESEFSEFTLHLVPTTIKQADQAARVARGEARAVKVKQD